MSKLWTPPSVSRELKDSTLEHNTAVLNMFELHGTIQEYWNPELKKLDPLLCLGRAKPRAFAVGVIANYWHLIRINPGAPIWVQPLHDNMKYVEPTFAMLQLLRQADLQNERVVRDRLKAEIEQENSEQRRKERESEQRIETMMDSWRARTQVRIPFKTDSRWSQNVAGKRGRRVN